MHRIEEIRIIFRFILYKWMFPKKKKKLPYVWFKRERAPLYFWAQVGTTTNPKEKFLGNHIVHTPRIPEKISTSNLH